MDDRIEGTAQNFAGRVQETVGNTIGDRDTQARGVYNQAAGQAKQTAADITDTIKAQPILSSLVALGIGYLIGRFTA
jgi:uncharacterized protein YjbJ (UPF0337 family)